MNSAANVDQLCPCGSKQPYSACCGPWHHGATALRAPDAPSLMRSRYSAFVLDELPYLLATWHPSTRPASLEPNPPGMKWLGLEIRTSTAIDTDHASVEFIARSKLAGKASRLHEISRFVREDGRWFYIDGEFPKRRAS